MTVVRWIAGVLGLVVGLYFIARAAAEPFLIDFSDPASYRHDSGGPSLAGVLLVHCGLGTLAAAVIAAVVLRRRARRRTGRGALIDSTS